MLTDGLHSYHVLEVLANYTVVDVNHEESRVMFHLNTVNSLYSYIKETYEHHRGVVPKYINRYNALFFVAFRCANSLKDTLFSSLCTVNWNFYWHGVKDVRNHNLVVL